MPPISRSPHRRLSTGAAVLAVAGLGLVPATAGTTTPAAQGAGSPSLTHLAQLQYKAAAGSTPNRGTDIEFATLRDRTFALAGTYKNGLQIIDVSDPAEPVVTGVYDCGVQQGDVQVFTRELEDGVHTYVGTTMDTGYTATTTTACYKEAKALGFGPVMGTNGFGTFIADITNPSKPRTVSFVPFAQGSHNHTIDPSGRFLYNSNSDLITSVAGLSAGSSAGLTGIEITDITDLSNPVAKPDLVLPPVPTGLGTEAHDITFNDKGTRAYAAALSQTVVIDTTNLAAPKVISTIVDPTINVHHQADPVTVTDPVLGKRDFLVIEDEFAGASGTGQCPNGGVHVYDLSNEAVPVKVGFWNISDVGATTNGVGRCTAHVFDLLGEAGLMTIAYYNGGVRVVDISGLVGAALGTAGAVGMKELGWYRFPNGDTWAAKTPGVAKDGTFHLYGNDQARGLDVYRFDAKKGVSEDAGRWLSAAEADRVLPTAQVDSAYRLMCMRGAV